MTFFVVLALVVLAGLALLAAAFGSWGLWLLAAVLVLVAALGVYDLLQRKHSVLRNYPVLGHLRYLLEKLRPELQQYFIERDWDGKPYDRDTRSVIYERAKGIHGEKAFGTELNVEEVGYEYLVHSTAPLDPPAQPHRVRIGGPDCTQPYDMALLNVSAMSFGALSGNALEALNRGAAAGNFAHDTGEGGLTKYHLSGGGDIVWEVGSGYFGTRTRDGDFDPEQFRDKAAHDQVKCVSLKLSQGAKPGIGGVLPGAKVTQEIAEARGVPKGEKCVSPASHRVFHTPAPAGPLHRPDARAGRRQAAGLQALRRLPARAAGDLQGDGRGGRDAGLHRRRRLRGRHRGRAAGVRGPRGTCR